MSTHDAAPAPLAALALAPRVPRVSKLWTQTILAPVVSSALFILVFGLSLGSRIKRVEGFPYDEFIVPGLIAMAMAQAAYSNNSSSIFQARTDRYINDVLASPMHPWQMNLGYASAGPSGRSRSAGARPDRAAADRRPGRAARCILIAALPARRRCSAPSAWSSASTPRPSTTTPSSTTS